MTRPVEVTELARAVFDFPVNHPGLTREISRLGWVHESTHPMSGVWWLRKGEIEVMVNFGGPRKVARAWSWRVNGGASERI